MRNDNNVVRVKLERIETSTCSIINIRLSTSILGCLCFNMEYFAENISELFAGNKEFVFLAEF